MIHTDGQRVEFICATRKSESRHLPDLKMSDLPDLSLTDFHVYGIEPGHKYLVTAVDGEGYLGIRENQNCIRFSKNEWHAKAGVKIRRYEQQTMKREEGITTIESEMPSRKTASPESFADSCQCLFDYIGRLNSFYGSYFTNHRFLAYHCQQKVANEVANLFVSGGKKYKYRNKHE